MKPISTVGVFQRNKKPYHHVSMTLFGRKNDVVNVVLCVTLYDD